MIALSPAFAAPSTGLKNRPPLHLTAGQKQIASEVLADLDLTNKINQGGRDFGNRVAIVQDADRPLIAKLPAGDLKKCLSLELQAYQDIYTINYETNKYPYYDLIENKQTPKILKKYNIQIDLRTPNEYTRLDGGKISSITTLLSQVAVILQSRAQGDIR
jgi:hypothetical protein